ncbi:helix-turn-helix transcriptional regulator [Desulfococcaceae bacterium HSG8]|nr:helix-turn-helix transcriptional regulator [Desulfococcaceae bacterium HSG8]
MIVYHIRDLMLRKDARTGKKITYETIAEATGISKMTISRMAARPGYNASAETIEKLCRFFECSIEELVSFLPDHPETAPSDSDMERQAL